MVIGCIPLKLVETRQRRPKENTLAGIVALCDGKEELKDSHFKQMIKDLTLAVQQLLKENKQ